MSVSREEFGTSPAGERIDLYTITNSQGMSAQVTNYGAILVTLTAPDKDGRLEDVVLGFDRVQDYCGNPSFFGTTIGPSANRIGGAKFILDGKSYELDINDGENNLHSHMEQGWHKRVWEARAGENSVCFTITDKDGNMGFPANKKCSLTFMLTDEGRLILHYYGEYDRRGLLNLTNHAYFNLDGHASGSIEDHTLWLKASRYTPVKKGCIPTGELAPVAGTPMDFTTPHRIGERIEEDFEQLKLGKGYDHNWVIDDFDGSVQHFATVWAKQSGRVMRVYTNLPGVQFYAGNCVDPQTGKGGAAYGKRCGLCLETQFFPDTANRPEFPSAVFGPNRIYDYTTVYEFVTEK